MLFAVSRYALYVPASPYTSALFARFVMETAGTIVSTVTLLVTAVPLWPAASKPLRVNTHTPSSVVSFAAIVTLNSTVTVVADDNVFVTIRLFVPVSTVVPFNVAEAVTLLVEPMPRLSTAVAVTLSVCALALFFT